MLTHVPGRVPWTGGQLVPVESNLPAVQTKATFMAALSQKGHRCRWLYNCGTGFWIKGQLFPGLLATAPCNYHVQHLVTGPVLLGSGPAPWASIWGKPAALEAYQASPGTAAPAPHPSRGEGAWESPVALGSIGCEEGERFIWIWVFCALCEASEGTMRTGLHCSSFPHLWGRFPGKDSL